MNEQKNKLIMVVLDGLSYNVALSSMGYLNHLVESSQASFYKVLSELPSLSRPLYEVLLTGTPSSVNGITANHVARLSKEKSIFHLGIEHGLTTAAAAYYWVSELYNKAPFEPMTDREQHDKNQPIQHGKFYFEDSYPDSHLFADAEDLRKRWEPDFLYVHSMGIDDAGHKFGSDSKQYRGQAIMVDSMLAGVLPTWLDAGYQVIITSDHGMNPDGQHGGTGMDVREVPFICIGSDFEPGMYKGSVPQLTIAPMVCHLLGLPRTDKMIRKSIPGFKLNEDKGEVM